jgi:hypothetical protein
MKELEAVFAASKADALVPTKSYPMPSTVSPIATVPLTPYVPEVPVVRKRRFSQKILDEIAKNPYYAYTTRFDEVITPSEFSEPSETMKLHNFLLSSLRKRLIYIRIKSLHAL